jgi:hypothetical protein
MQSLAPKMSNFVVVQENGVFRIDTAVRHQQGVVAQRSPDQLVAEYQRAPDRLGAEYQRAPDQPSPEIVSLKRDRLGMRKVSRNLFS